MSTRWTVLCLDFHYILSMYLNRRYSYLKNVKLCANMLIKNIFTSDTEHEPGRKYGVDWDKCTVYSLISTSACPSPLLAISDFYNLVNQNIDKKKNEKK